MVFITLCKNLLIKLIKPFCSFKELLNEDYCYIPIMSQYYNFPEE